MFAPGVPERSLPHFRGETPSRPLELLEHEDEDDYEMRYRPYPISPIGPIRGVSQRGLSSWRDLSSFALATTCCLTTRDKRCHRPGAMKIWTILGLSLALVGSGYGDESPVFNYQDSVNRAEQLSKQPFVPQVQELSEDLQKLDYDLFFRFRFLTEHSVCGGYRFFW